MPTFYTALCALCDTSRFRHTHGPDRPRQPALGRCSTPLLAKRQILREARKRYAYLFKQKTGCRGRWVCRFGRYAKQPCHSHRIRRDIFCGKMLRGSMGTGSFQPIDDGSRAGPNRCALRSASAPWCRSSGSRPRPPSRAPGPRCARRYVPADRCRARWKTSCPARRHPR